MSLQSEILQIINNNERLRASSLASKFNMDQINHINSIQTDEEFKVKALRAVGYGNCKHCEKYSQYQGKLKFYTYCSKDCIVSAARSARATKIINDQISNTSIIKCLDAQNYESVQTDLTFLCNKNHTFKTSIEMLYRSKNRCEECSRDSEKDAEESLIKEKEKRYQATIEKRNAKKLKTAQNNKEKTLALLGTESNKICLNCKKLTKYVLSKSGNYTVSPAYCNSDCKESFLKTKRLETIKNHYDLVKVSKPHIILNLPIKDSIMQSYTFPKCGHTAEIRYKNLSFQNVYESGKCPKCGRFESTLSRKIKEVLEDINVQDIVINDRSVLAGKELDIWVPSKKIGIECNGLYWHSDLYKEDNYHLLKTEQMKILGNKLIHVFEDEIEFKFEIVKSRLAAIFGKAEKIYARNCTLKELPPVIKRDFLNTTHLQGDTASSKNYGLYHKNELVACMTFRRPRDARMAAKYEYELIRYSSKLNVTVVGGASKLLTHFEKTIRPTSLLTYADRRWSEGNLYEKLGFTFIRNTEIGYFYQVGKTREHRYKFRKKSITEQFKQIDSSLTEREMMKSLGYPQIYDCGSMVFAKVY